MNNFRIFAFALTLSVSIPALAATPSTEEKPDTKISATTEVPAETTPVQAEDLEADGIVSPISEEELENAQATDTQERQNVSEVDFNTVESFGLLEQSRGEGLGKQFYSKSKRSAITSLISAMPDTNWNVMRNIGNQALLTAANTDVIENDSPIDYANGKDLLTLRVEKLIERGLYKEAYTFYTRMKVQPYNEKLARLGIISMLLNAQKPLACVELKTTDVPNKTDSFWKELDAYCVLSLSDQKFPELDAILNTSKHGVIRRILNDKSFNFTYSPTTFESLSLLEKALLVGENRLNLVNTTPAAIRQIPANHIQPLLTIPTLDNTTRILLSARAVEAGVMPAADFAKVYIKIGRKAEKEKKHLTGFEKIADLYWKRLDTFEPQLRKATISEILGLTHAQNYVLLVPYLDELAKFSATDSYSIEDLNAIIRAYFLIGKEIPAGWLELIRKAYTPDAAQQSKKEILLISAALMSGEQENSTEKLKEIYNLLEKPLNPELAQLKNIIENIDNRTGDYAKVDLTYENGFDTAAEKGYTLPPVALMEQLKVTRSSQATGETALLCNLILKDTKQQTVYPGVLADVAKALGEAGLGKEAQRLLAEVVLSYSK